MSSAWELPLHIKEVVATEPLVFLPLVSEFVPELLDTYVELVAPYVDKAGAEKVFGPPGPVHPDEIEQAKISCEDLERLLAAGYVEPLPENARVEGTVKLFSVEETEKQRRRLICWPQWLNDIDLGIEDFDVPLPTVADVTCGAASFLAANNGATATTLDLASWFYHFRMGESARNGYVFRAGGLLYRLISVPTGARRPPKFAQIVALALARAAHKRHLEENPRAITSLEVYIDNTRALGCDSARFAHHYVKVCASWNVKVNEPEATSSIDYTFLGIHFEHRSSSPNMFVGLAAKTKLKLLRFAMRCGNCRTMTRDELRSGVGVLFWAARVLSLNLATKFALIMWARRLLGKPGPDVRPHIDLASWAEEVATHSSVLAIPKDICRAITLVTDASDVGWAGVFVLPAGYRANLSILAGPWFHPVIGHNDDVRMASINVRELRAVRLSLERFKIPDIFATSRTQWTAIQWVGDNSSSLAWARKGFAPCLPGAAEVAALRRCCDERFFFLGTPRHVPGIHNVADAPSRWGRWAAGSWTLDLDTAASATDMATALAAPPVED